MSTETPKPPRQVNARNLFRAVFIVLGLGLLVAATVAWNDNQHRGTLERVEMPTGLGVDEYFVLPDPLEFQKSLGTFGGLPIFVASMKIRDLRENELEVWVSGREGEPPVFRRYFGGRDDAKDKEREYFLKVGPGQYLRVHQGEDQKPFASGQVGMVVRKRVSGS
jgi:hypothetical protein